MRFLTDNREAILADAVIGASAAPRYASDAATTRQRLATLFEVLADACEKQELSSAVSYARVLAQTRFGSGYDLAQVQTAINALEEAVWRRAIEADEPAGLLRTVSTVLGVVKDVLAREYVHLATGAQAPAVDVDTLFAGQS
jgi:hypothetical protein